MDIIIGIKSTATATKLPHPVTEITVNNGVIKSIYKYVTKAP